MTETDEVVGALDIGGTKIAVGLVDGCGRVQERRDIPTPGDRPFGHACDQVIAILADQVRETGVSLRGIGIGATGPIDPETGAFGLVPFFPRWLGANPVERLSEAFGVPVAAENDADAAALGEARWGAGVEAQRFLLVTVGTGIGGGIVVDRRLYRGSGGAHPEIGHLIVEAFGPACTCGGRGCWEALAAGPAMAEWFASRTGAAGATARDVCALAREGDVVARQAVTREAEYLGVGLATLIAAFAPDLIALGGSVMNSYDLFADAMHAVIAERCTLVPLPSRGVVRAALGADVGLVGAAEVWRHRFEDRQQVS